MEENESQKLLQANPGFWSCAAVGTNHPVHPETCCALVFAWFLKYQVLETWALDGATIQNLLDAIHISLPPCMEVPNGGLDTDTVVVA